MIAYSQASMDKIAAFGMLGDFENKNRSARVEGLGGFFILRHAYCKLLI